MRKNAIRIAAALSLGLALAGCAKGKAADAKKADEQAKTVFAVSTTLATKGELRDYLEFGGDVSAKTNVDITPDTTGRVAEIRVRVGDRVAKDQIVALVDPSRPGMTYEFSPVKSPIAGTVTAVNAVLGSMATPQLAVARVGRMDSLEVAMNVPERYVSKIKPDQKAILRLDAYPGETFPAAVSEISPVLDPSSRTMAVKLRLESNDGRVKAGMFARVKLVTDTLSGVITVPDAAVVSRFGEYLVFVVVPGAADAQATVRKVAVKPGIRVDDKIEVREGLAAGDEVVVRGQTMLEDGSPVNVVSRVEPLPAAEAAR